MRRGMARALQGAGHVPMRSRAECYRPSHAIVDASTLRIRRDEASCSRRRPAHPCLACSAPMPSSAARIRSCSSAGIVFDTRNLLDRDRARLTRILPPLSVHDLTTLLAAVRAHLGKAVLDVERNGVLIAAW